MSFWKQFAILTTHSLWFFDGLFSFMIDCANILESDYLNGCTISLLMDVFPVIPPVDSIPFHKELSMVYLLIDPRWHPDACINICYLV